MIAFILLCYVFVAWLIFAKFKLIPFDMKAKIATTVIGVIIVVGMNIWVNFVHPQSLDVRVFEHVVEISSRLPQPGRVVEVNVEPNLPVQAGAPLFKIDPRPYQFEVDRLAAALKEAEQSVPQLEAAYNGAKSQVAQLTDQLELAERTYERDLAANKSGGGAVSEQRVDEARQSAAAAKNAVDAATAAAEQARIAVELATPKIDQLKAQLASANLNLEETQLVAPADGFVANLTLKPGAIVTPGQPVMSFVYNPEGIVVASFPQEYLRGVEPDDPVEIALDLYPGEILTGHVDTVIWASGGGQITPTGDLPTWTAKLPRTRFAVRMVLDESAMENRHIPPGAGGSAAIYTKQVPPLRVLRQIILRWYTWLNYIKFTL